MQGGDYALFLGRLVPEKAPDLLVRAFRNVDTTARLVIAGGSSFTDRYVHELEVLAARDPRVLLVGSVHGELLHELYTNAALFVLPSRLEGLALTLLEAASYRLPLVASDIAPNREVIGDDGPGRRMFASGDAAGLTAALTATLRQPPRSVRRGRGARRSRGPRIRLGCRDIGDRGRLRAGVAPFWRRPRPAALTQDTPPGRSCSSRRAVRESTAGRKGPGARLVEHTE